jgi:hypothetical protein
VSVQARAHERSTASEQEPARAPESPRLSPDAAAVLRLQQTAGNAAVTALVQRQEAGGGLSLGGTRRSGPSLLGGEGLRLDPAIEAELRRLELERHVRELLEPGSVRSAFRAAPIDLSAPPPSRPAWLPPPGGTPAPEPAPVVPRGAGPETPREASPGDVLDAVMAVPAVDGALTRLRTQATDRLAADWRSLSGGGKAAVVTSLVTIGGGALAGALANPESRNFLLDQLNGRDLPVPGVDGLSVSFSTQRENLGVMFTLDVGRHLPESLGFR